MTCTKDERQGRGVCRPDKCGQPDCAMAHVQHPERERTGVRKQAPRLPAADFDPTTDKYEHQLEPTTAELLHRIGYWTVVTVIAVASLIVLCGFAGYLWVRWHQI